MLSLRLPRANAKQAEGSSYHELAGHPWAGMRVRMTLSAKDQAGQTGKSEPVEFMLPQRRFRNPLARAVIEQRRNLIEDPRNRDQVVMRARCADAGARRLHHRSPRLSRPALRLSGGCCATSTRAGMKSVVDQLWHVALRLEDGNLSEAERRLREAQEKLAKALQEGATDEEIQQLMQELRQALNEFLEQMPARPRASRPSRCRRACHPTRC